MVGFFLEKKLYMFLSYIPYFYDVVHGFASDLPDNLFF
jgi:hypothetical protein